MSEKFLSLGNLDSAVLRLKKIELNGFKSFGEGATLSLQENLLGIVGPNGSGKSNILDAIHFVFGEQKPSVMRVSKISDVIFSGTQSHPPLGAARVYLHFECVPDDSEGDIRGARSPMGLDELDANLFSFDDLEVEDTIASYASAPPGSQITELTPLAQAQSEEELDMEIPKLRPGDTLCLSRVVYRDGVSEYFLNGNKASLAAIDRLFSQYQLGRHSVFTINQGEVERKLLSSATEMREWLGEASGIALVLRAKASCERKLERTNRNLIRVKDILSNSKDELEVLRLQALDAEKAVYLNNLLWQLRARMLLQSLMRTLRRREKVLEEKRNYKERAFNLATTLETLKNEQTELEEELKHIAITEKNLEARLEALRNELSGRSISESLLSEKVRTSQERLAELSEWRSQGEKELVELRSELEKKRIEHQAIEKNSQQVLEEEEKLKAQIKLLSAQLAFAVDSANEKAEELSRLEKAVLVTEERLSHLEGEKHSLEARLAELSKAEVESGETVISLELSIKETQDELRDLQEKLKESEEHLENQEKILNKLRSEIISLEKARSDLREKLSALRTAHDNYEELKAEFYRLQEEKEGDLLVTPLLDLIAFSREWSQAAAVALGEAAEGFVSFESREKIEEAKASGVFILPLEKDVSADKTRQEERASSEATTQDDFPGKRPYESLWDQIHGKKELIDALRAGLGEFAICDSTAEGWKLLSERSEVSAVVIRGKSMVLRRGLIKKGSSAHGGALFLKHSELPLIKEEIEKLEAKLVELRDASNAREREEKKLSSEVMLTQNKVKDLQALVTEAKSRLSGLNSKKASYSEVKEKLSEEKTAVSRRLEQTLSELKEKKAELVELKKYFKSVGEEKNKLDSSLSELREKFTLAEEAQRKFSVEGVTISSRLEALKGEIMRIEEEIGKKASALSQLELDSDELERELRRLIKESEEAKEKVRQAQVEVERSEAELQSLEEKKDFLNERLAEVKAEMVSVESGLKKLGAGTSEIDERVWQANQDLAEVVRQIHHELGVSISTMLSRIRGSFCAPQIQPADFFPESKGVPEPKKEVAETFFYPLLYYDELSESRAQEEVARIKRALQNLGEVNPLAPRHYKEKKDNFERLSKEWEELTKTSRELKKAISTLDARSRELFAKRLKLIEAKFNELFIHLFGGGFARFRLTEPNDITSSGIEIEVQLPGGRRQNIKALSGGERSLLFIALFLAVHITRPGSFCILDEVDAALDDVNVARLAKLLQELSKKEQFIVITHNKRTMRIMERLIGVVNQPKGMSKIIEVNLRQAEAYADRGAA